jgi:hypothetical protein
MKGIRTDAIRITTNKIYPKLNQVELKNNWYYSIWGHDKTSLEQLYEYLYDGKANDFDLYDSASPNFEMNSNFSIETKSSFIRKIQCWLTLV